MTSIQQNAIAIAQRAQRSIAGVSVSYVRAGETPLALTAVPGNTRTETVDTLGTAVQSRVRDYLIEAAVLIFDDEVSTPQDGDEIHEEINGQTHKYQVAPIGGDKSYRPSDPYGLTWRIHTQLIDVV